MRKAIVSIMVMILTAFGQMGFDVGAQFGLPMGDFSDTGGIGFGASGRVLYPYSEKIDLTGKIGFSFWTGDTVTNSDYYYDAYYDEYIAVDVTDEYSYVQIPFLFGGKYKLSPEFYGLAELGMAVNISNWDHTYWGDYSDNSETSVGFSISVGAGYLMNEKFDLSGYFNSIMADGGTFEHIGFRFGYRFM